MIPYHDLTTTPLPRAGGYGITVERFRARVRWRNLKADAEGNRKPVFPAAAILRLMLAPRGKP